MIHLQDIRKAFNAGQANEFLALDQVTLTIESGKASVFKGPSGSGKTTLLSLLGCMARPTSGRITLNGREITSLPERFLTDIRRDTFGIIFQRYNLIRGITVLENVMLPAYPKGPRYRGLKRRAMELLALLNVAEKAKVKVEWLSGGEAQRTAIARALINSPAYIIADEPTAHLDTHLSMEFMAIMGRLKEEGKTILLASHDPIVVESEIIDRVIALRDGKVIATGAEA
jgi:putative ABC transport system ATP-binding protein